MKRLISILFLFTAICSTASAEHPYDLYDALGVDYVHTLQSKNILGYYNPMKDKIYLRPARQFEDIAERNHTMLHELGHWARADNRLGPIGGCDSTPEHLEEIVVDIAAAVLGDQLGVRRNHNRDIDDYILQQAGRKRITEKQWRLIQHEVERTVKYLVIEGAEPVDFGSYFVSLRTFRGQVLG